MRGEKARGCPYRLDYGIRPVRLPERPGVPLWLVVVRGLGREPIAWLTHLLMRKKHKVLWWVVSAYHTRWRAEEPIRFAKQCYDLEDIRVKIYGGPRNTVAPVMAAAFFTAIVLGTTVKPQNLAIRLRQVALRLVRIPDFRYYALGNSMFRSEGFLFQE